MKRLFSAKTIAAAAVAFGAVAATSAAHAGSEVVFSIGFNTPAYVHPAPVYVQPQPVYVQPQPVYVQPRPVYVQPRPVYVQPAAPVYYGYDNRHVERRGPWGDRDGDGIPNRYDPDSRWYEPQQRHQRWIDSDRDGVPDYRDHRPHNPYRY
jgi:hypothetical protein